MAEETGIETETVEAGVDPAKEVIKEDHVSYDSYKKAVDQNKRARAKNLELQEQQTVMLDELKNYRSRDKDVEQKKLEEKGEYDKILQSLRTENKALVDTIETDKTDRISRKKRDAFLKSLPGVLHNERYLELASLKDIAVDPETGEVDSHTVKMAVDAFVTDHPALIKHEKQVVPAVKQATNTTPRPVNLAHLDKDAKQLSALEQYRQLLLQEHK